MRMFQTWGKIETRMKARAHGDEKTRDIINVWVLEQHLR